MYRGAYGILKLFLINLTKWNVSEHGSKVGKRLELLEIESVSDEDEDLYVDNLYLGTITASTPQLLQRMPENTIQLK